MKLRELGIEIGPLQTGPKNDITDIPGIEVGQVTLIEDGPSTCRTGLTAILPNGKHNLWDTGLFAGHHSLNGYGEMTGTTWLSEAGQLNGPICLTSSFAVGAVHEGLTRLCDDLPAHGNTQQIVAETWDGWLHDPADFPIKPSHVKDAIDQATSNPVQEGNHGGGTGMVCHDFKGGTGSSSRQVEIAGKKYSVGVLVQTNYGDRADFNVAGIPVGKLIDSHEVPLPERKVGGTAAGGSIVIIIATDAPLSSQQCTRLAKRATIGLAKVGGYAHNGSGDLFLAFSTANKMPIDSLDVYEGLSMLPHKLLDPLFHGCADAVEEAILNAMCAAESMIGQLGRSVHALPLNRLKEIWEKHRIT